MAEEDGERDYSDSGMKDERVERAVWMAETQAVWREHASVSGWHDGDGWPHRQRRGMTGWVDRRRAEGGLRFELGKKKTDA